MALREAPVSDAAARSPQGANDTIKPLIDLAVTTTHAAFDLTAWKGRLVDIAITGAARYLFSTQSATLDTTTENLVAGTGVTNGGAILPVAGIYPRVVPLPEPATNTAKVYLLIEAMSGTIDVSVSVA